MSNDSAHGRAVGTHPGSFSGGEYCRWTSWAQTDSDALCARSGPVDSQHRRAMAHAAAELPELQNCASALSDLVPRCFDFYMIEAKPENLIGDRAYDSDPLDAELRKDGIEMIAPHRSNRSKPPTQDRRRLSRYMRRWLVERFFAWIQWQRRILVRWEYHAHNFLGFVQLACLVILFKQF